MTDTTDPALHFARLLASHPECRAAAVHRTADKGDSAFQKGDSSLVFIVEHGLVKLSFISKDGKEWIRSFVAAPGVFSDVYLQAPEEGATFAALCLEPCTFTIYPYDLLMRVGAQNPILARAGFDIVQYYLLQRERRARNMLSLSAAEAYQDFLKEHARIAERITQADTARYLGITPVALSRIRQRLGV